MDNRQTTKKFGEEKKPEVIKMPEAPVFARYLAIGFVGAEVFRIAFYLGGNFNEMLLGLPAIVRWCVAECAAVFALLICIAYCLKRGAHTVAARMARSRRVDLLAVIVVGIIMNELSSPWIAGFHATIAKANPLWALAVLALLCIMMASPMRRRSAFRRVQPAPYFLPDEEVTEGADDLLANDGPAAEFAKIVLESGAHAGLLFGVEGPWGVGKTSFINFAARHWEQAENQVIVCRFEPLRYASEPDLADRLIRDLTAAIQRKVFAPEFRPAAARYARLIRGKADFSFLGFRLSLEPSQETIEDLLEDIDEVLKRINRRVIIVIDDLDRLDLKAANSLLFATRRTFSLSQATYVLCYDTEVLAEGGDEGARAREFLEKFVTVKMSLFVDNSSLQKFLLRDWQQADTRSPIPSVAMSRLAVVLSELANILGSDHAPKYRVVLGDLRKVKRFVNAMLMMRIDRTELGDTDFDSRDLIHLMLLHLNYPGIFRRVYAEETEGKKGIFSVRWRGQGKGYENAKEFSELMMELDERKQPTARFLLQQLFDADALKLADRAYLDDAALRARACFNHSRLRNLDTYLKLLVRFVVPMPQETYVLYKRSVEQVRKGESISKILTSPELRLEHGDGVHDEFWTVLISRCHTFPRRVVDDAIDTLVAFLPYYSAVGHFDRSVRQRSIYSLLQLLNRGGWEDNSGRHHENHNENTVEIAQRIFGERSHQGRGLLDRLAADERGVLGWNDLMLFRLQSSQDRQGQLFNLFNSLIVNQDSGAATDGLISDLARRGMRKLSQVVFSMFKRTYIDQRRNFYQEVDNTPAQMFLGSDVYESDPRDSTGRRSAFASDDELSAARSGVKSFVIYQLSNSRAPNRSGVGCGYYDESGSGDRAGIAKQINTYVFDVCFAPEHDSNNIFHFLDHCMMHLTNPVSSGENGYIATQSGIPGGLDPNEMGGYWKRHRDLIRQRCDEYGDRRVMAGNYVASYREHLPSVFRVLDELAMEPASEEFVPDGKG